GLDFGERAFDPDPVAARRGRVRLDAEGLRVARHAHQAMILSRLCDQHRVAVLVLVILSDLELEANRFVRVHGQVGAALFAVARGLIQTFVPEDVTAAVDGDQRTRTGILLRALRWPTAMTVGIAAAPDQHDGETSSNAALHRYL